MRRHGVSGMNIMIGIVLGMVVMVVASGGIGDLSGYLGMFGDISSGRTQGLHSQFFGQNSTVSGGNELPTAQDPNMDVVAVPLYYNPADQDDAQDRFEANVAGIASRWEARTPLESGSVVGGVVSIGSIGLPEPSPPQDSMERSHATLTCRQAVETAFEFVMDNGYAQEADKILVIVNGTYQDEPVILQELTMAGCTNGIGGDVSVIEDSIFQDAVAPVGTHELGHAFGLCHTRGVQQGSDCDLQDIPRRPSICTDRNDANNAGAGDIMNYCLPLEYFSGEDESGHDEYNVLERLFTENGWIQ